MKKTNFLLFVIITMLMSCEKDEVTATATATATEFEPMIMADGRVWTTRNLDVWVDGAGAAYDSYLHYSWKGAIKACEVLGDEWRLPTRDEWYNLAAEYGGWDYSSIWITKLLSETWKNEEAYEKLIHGAESGFDALLNGYYWSATAKTAKKAWAFRFQQVDSTLYMDSYNKLKGNSCRCIQD